MIQKILAQSYLITMLAAIAVGLFVPQATALIAWNTLLLQAIFFLSCLKIEPKTVFKQLKDWRFLLLANFMMLLGFPLVVWLLSLPWRSDFAFALFLLAAMPVGMTAPLLVEIANGKQSIAMVLTVTTSLLAPFTVPLLTKILFSAQISVDALSMFKQLVMVIFVPFALAMIVRALAKKTIATVRPYTKAASTLLLGLLIVGAVAKQAGPIVSLISNAFVLIAMLALLYAFIFLLHIAGYYSFWWEPKEIRQTSSISLTYMNFTLAIFLASQFFPRPGIILPLVLVVIPWATFMPAWKRSSAKWK